MKACILLILLVLMPVITRSGDFLSGSTTCPSSGAAKVSTTNATVFQLTISANIGNTGNLHLGGSDVTITTGGVLVPGASYNANKPNPGLTLTSLYFACTVNTDGLTWIASR